MEAIRTKDAIVDPHQTIGHFPDPLYKDPGYKELNKRNTREEDLRNKVIHDN
jgi:hypothetical protein